MISEGPENPEYGKRRLLGLSTRAEVLAGRMSEWYTKQCEKRTDLRLQRYISAVQRTNVARLALAHNVMSDPTYIVAAYLAHKRYKCRVTCVSKVGGRNLRHSIDIIVAKIKV